MDLVIGRQPFLPMNNIQKISIQSITITSKENLCGPLPILKDHLEVVKMLVSAFLFGLEGD